MVQHLSTAKEVALDLEHHHYRSFQGFTCLMQLSTRQEDFIVDTLALRAHLGAALTPIFAEPKVRELLLSQAVCVCVMWSLPKVRTTAAQDNKLRAPASHSQLTPGAMCADREGAAWC